MRFVVDGYEIEVKARKADGPRNRAFTDEATMEVMNHISLAFSWAGERCENHNMPAIAQQLKDNGTAVYNVLSEAGLYTNI